VSGHVPVGVNVSEYVPGDYSEGVRVVLAVGGGGGYGLLLGRLLLVVVVVGGYGVVW